MNEDKLLKQIADTEEKLRKLKAEAVMNGLANKLDTGSETSAQPSTSCTPFVAITVQKVVGGWICLTYEITGDRATLLEKSQENMRAIAIEHFKIQAAKRFMI
jgi:hypothetical protein